MNKVTDINVIEFMKTLWNVDSIKARVNGENIIVEIEHSSSVGIDFDRLLKMVEFFGTKEIDIDNSFSSGGCDTCSYGSAYTMEFTIKPEKK